MIDAIRLRWWWVGVLLDINSGLLAICTVIRQEAARQQVIIQRKIGEL